MPELPEVEVVRRGLAAHLPGRTITGFSCSGKSLRWPIPARQLSETLPGQLITAVNRRAKYLLIELGSSQRLIIHLGMTGKLGLFTPDAPPLPHDHACWGLDNRMQLRFNDVRRFGALFLSSGGHEDGIEQRLFGAIGPEPFAEEFSAGYLRQRARQRTQPVKNFIMNSHVVAGVGNIYANESLFRARIRPQTPAGRISVSRWQRLIGEIRKVLEEAIACGGSTISDFFGASGESGYFQVQFSVYGRANQPCPGCSGIIRKIILGGRASFYCPHCQH